MLVYQESYACVNTLVVSDGASDYRLLTTAYWLISVAVSPEDRRDRANDDFKVKEQRPVFDIIQVVARAFLD